MIKIQYVLKKEKLKSKMISQVHDELLFEIHEKEEDVIDKIKHIMENEHIQFRDFNTPIRVDSGKGNNWGEAH